MGTRLPLGGTIGGLPAFYTGLTDAERRAIIGETSARLLGIGTLPWGRGNRSGSCGSSHYVRDVKNRSAPASEPAADAKCALRRGLSKWDAAKVMGVGTRSFPGTQSSRRSFPSIGRSGPSKGSGRRPRVSLRADVLKIAGVQSIARQELVEIGSIALRQPSGLSHVAGGSF
jgi:hypothetical protein